VGSVVAGRYQVTAIRGAGMMGVVLEAHDTVLGARVALKILRPEITAAPELRARLMREAAIVARLQSPNVVRVFDFGHTPDGLPFFAMELLEGADLDTLAGQGRQFTIPEAVSLVRQACAGVAEAHALGVVHRDLKPHNLFLVKLPDGSELLKVLDFGISKVVGDDAHLTATQATLGTPAYMSPEHVRSARTIDARSDVWALGVVLFELLTRRLPFAGDSSHSMIAAIVADPPLRLSSLRPDAPEGLDRVVAAALAKDPAARIPSVVALAQALAQFELAGGQRSAPVAQTVLDPTASLRPSPRAVDQTVVAGPLPQGPAAAPQGKAAGAPTKVLAVAALIAVAAVVLPAIIWLGVSRRRQLATPSAAQSAEAEVEATPEPTLASVLAKQDRRASWDACIERPDAELPALIREPPSGLEDLDPRLGTAPPRLVLDVPSSGPSEGGDELRLVPITPLSRALRVGPAAVLLVTDRSMFVGVEGDRILEQVSTEEQRRRLSSGIVKTAAGWVVVPEGGMPASRLRAALELLSGAKGSVVLAVPVSRASPPDLPAAPDDGLSCGPEVVVAAKAPAAAHVAALEEALAKAADACSPSGHEQAGAAFSLIVKPQGAALSVCVERDEVAAPALRRCLVDATSAALSASPARPRAPTRLRAILDGPLVRALCR
jgi:tRNA A-37 threonylcarbamoyl transferase component Bud32